MGSQWPSWFVASALQPPTGPAPLSDSWPLLQAERAASCPTGRGLVRGWVGSGSGPCSGWARVPGGSPTQSLPVTAEAPPWERWRETALVLGACLLRPRLRPGPSPPAKGTVSPTAGVCSRGVHRRSRGVRTGPCTQTHSWQSHAWGGGPHIPPFPASRQLPLRMSKSGCVSQLAACPGASGSPGLTCFPSQPHASWMWASSAHGGAGCLCGGATGWWAHGHGTARRLPGRVAGPTGLGAVPFLTCFLLERPQAGVVGAALRPTGSHPDRAQLDCGSSPVRTS